MPTGHWPTSRGWGKSGGSLVAEVEALATSNIPREAGLRTPGMAATNKMVQAATTQRRKADPVCGWLLSMGWVEMTPKDRLRLTGLGRALLAALRESPKFTSPSKMAHWLQGPTPDDPLVQYELTRSC